jgi:glutathione S-transferase
MYILYHFPYSQHARRVVSLLEAAGLPYELRHVDMAKGEHLSAAYLAVNPNHQVPTLLDGDLKLHESNVILRYLCQKHGLTDWYPADLKQRARVDQWLDWNQCRLSPAVIDIVFNTLFAGEQ